MEKDFQVRSEQCQRWLILCEDLGVWLPFWIKVWRSLLEVCEDGTVVQIL